MRFRIRETVLTLLAWCSAKPMNGSVEMSNVSFWPQAAGQHTPASDPFRKLGRIEGCPVGSSRQQQLASLTPETLRRLSLKQIA